MGQRAQHPLLFGVELGLLEKNTEMTLDKIKELRKGRWGC